MKRIVLLFLFVLFVTNSVQAAKVHIVREGDTLWDLAARHYGDPTLYSILLKVNNISNPRTILNGAAIVIPDKSSMEAIAKEKDPAKQKNMIDKAVGSNGANNGSDSEKDSKTLNINPDSITLENILNSEIKANSLLKVSTP